MKREMGWKGQKERRTGEGRGRRRKENNGWERWERTPVCVFKRFTL